MVQIAENERIQQQEEQQMNLMPAAEARTASETNIPASQPYDHRNFLPVTLMDTNSGQYSRPDQTSFQLV